MITKIIKTLPFKSVKRPIQQFTSPYIKTLNETKEFWDEFSQDYSDQFSENTSSLYMSMLNMIEVDKKQNILEAAIGTGYMLPHLMQRKKQGASVELIDLSTDFLKIAKKRLDLLVENPLQNLYNFDIKNLPDFKDSSYQQLGANVRQMSAEDLSFYEDNTFDGYLSCLCVHLTPSPENMIKETFRVLQPGGQAAFSVWGDKQKSTLMTTLPKILNKNKVPFQNERSPFHLNDKDQLIKMFEDLGFVNVLVWDQYMPLNLVKNVNSFDAFMSVRNMRMQMSQVPNSIRQKVYDETKQAFADILGSKQTIGLDTLMIYAEKPQ